MSRHVIFLLVISLLDAFSSFALGAQQGPFPVPAGLHGAVDFWNVGSHNLVELIRHYRSPTFGFAS